MKQFLFSIALLAALLTVSSGGPREPASVAASGQANPSAKPRYTVTDLGTLGDAFSQADGINEHGQVVGKSTFASTLYHAFLWDDGTMTGLGTLPDTERSFAMEINDAGQVVGASLHIDNNSVGYYSAFLWQNGGMQPLGTFGGPQSVAEAINNFGQVVGSAEITGPPARYHAFLWQNGAMQDLGTLGGAQSSALDINDVGEIVGQASTASPTQSHAFLWQNGTMQDLGGGDSSSAQAINNARQVVGVSDGRAFLWENGVMQDLDTLGGDTSVAFDINDAGQVVGSAKVDGSRAFLWEDNQMKDLNTLIPAGSGWMLRVAHAINEKGQIAGWGHVGGQAHAFLLTPRLPVLIIPGIAGTYAANAGSDIGWLTQRGVQPSELQVDPLGRVYHDLIQTLKNVGYVEGKDLFVVKYDWRLMPGPLDGNFDGHINGLDASTLADNQFNYAVDYLGYYLRQAAEAYRTEYGGALPQVNIIAHSTGGLVARAYIQSGAYGDEYDAVNHYDLPEVDQFIMIGVPNRGASKAWNPLHDNWIADVAYRAVLSKIINRAYQKVLAGQVIQGPDYNIDRASITVNGSPSPTLFIEKYVPTLRALLATYDFINFGSGYVTLNNDPAQRNDTILDLNAGLDLSPSGDSNSFASQTETTVICGASGTTANLVMERTGTAANDVLLPFTDFFANDASATDEWFEDLWLANGGDKTVPLESCQEQFLGDARIDIRLFTGASADHTGLMSNVDVQSAILDILKVKYQAQNISTGTGASLVNAISVISDPAETILVDGQGRRLGYSQATGVLTEIPGSVWFGEADGFGFSSGTVVEPLRLDLTGLGEDHYVMASVELAGKPAGGAVSSGYLAAGETKTTPISLTSCTAKPAKPTLMLPKDGKTVKKRKVWLDWGESGCADSYRVLVREGGPQGRKVEKVKNLPDTIHRTDALTRGQTYYWRASACNSIGCTKSAWRSFTIKP
ncbi:MAG: DUF3466 family protein [Anaerolineae bacterium]|nr:DUF3466 family protein [Anaerolineae bacterium]